MNIENILKGMKNFFHDLFSNIPGWVEREMPIIVGATSAIKDALTKGEAWLQSQTAETIVAIIPGTIDDQIRADLILILHQAIPVVQFVEDKEQSFGECLLSFIKALTKETEKGADSKLQAVSSVSLAIKDGNKLKENRYDSLSQVYFSKTQG